MRFLFCAFILQFSSEIMVLDLDLKKLKDSKSCLYDGFSKNHQSLNGRIGGRFIDILPSIRWQILIMSAIMQ